MAFPSVIAEVGASHAAATSIAAAIPDGSNVSGRLIIMCINSDASETFTWPAGWTQIAYHTLAAQTTEIRYHRTDGTEGYPSTGATITIGISSSEPTAHIAYLITGHHASTNPEASAVATSSGTTPDPPSFNPTNWDVEDTLWFAVASSNGGIFSAYPSSYTNGSEQHSGTGGSSADASIAAARRENATATEDPGTFTKDLSSQWLAFTVAVRPAPAAAAEQPAFRSRSILYAILTAWQIAAPIQQPSRHVVSEAVAEAPAQPPFTGRSTLSTILASWQPGAPVQQPIRRVVPEAAAEEAPVLSTRPWLGSVLQSWEPSHHVQQRKLIAPIAGTRFYFPSMGGAPVSPVFAGWGSTAGADRLRMVTERINSAETFKDFLDNEAGGTSYLWRQYVSDPIAAQSISGSVKGQLRCSESAAAVDFDQVLLSIRVFSADGLTLRGTLLALGQYGTTNEFSIDPTRTNRKIADGDPITTVVAQVNDRIVVEIGAKTSAGSGLSDAQIIAMFGDNSATDLPEDESTTASFNPWIEFSQDISFAEAPPPFDRAWLSTVLASWHPADPVPTRPRQYPPEQPAVEAAPAFSRTWLPIVVRSWQAVDPPPERRPTFPIGQPVDDPPFGQRPWMTGVLARWWQPPDPLPAERPRFPLEQPEDDPPFGQRSWLPGVLARWWQPPDPLPVRRPPRPLGQPEDNPPFGQRTWLRNVIDLAWKPADPLPVERPKFALEQPENNPPFGQRRWLSGVISAWDRDPKPFQVRRFVPPEVAAADNPPLGQRRWLSGVNAAWERAPDTLTGRRRVPQEFVAAADNPPFGQRVWIVSVLESWQQEPPVTRFRRLAQGQPENDPPFGQRSWLPGVVRSWQPPDPPRITRPTHPQGQVVDDPPFGLRSWFAGTRAAWDRPPDPLQRQRHVPEEFVVVTDNPPFGQRPWLSTVVRSWQPPDPLPTLGPPNRLAQAGVAAPEVVPPVERPCFDRLGPPDTGFSRAAAPVTAFSRQTLSALTFSSAVQPDCLPQIGYGDDYGFEYGGQQ